MKIIKQHAVLYFIFILLSGYNIHASDKVISYQSLIKNEFGQIVPNSTYQMDFVLYTDSTAGSIVWAESADITTTNGLMNHNIGSVNSLSSDLFAAYHNLYLEIRIGGEPISPRTPITGSAYAFTAGNLNTVDSSGMSSIATDENSHSLTIFDPTGVPYITLQNKPSDSALILPDSAINADEILDEPGLTLSTETNLITLNTGEMMDLTTVTIEIPDNGYIVLYGKCYLLLSGTTGANSAIVQIDENEGGGTQFPYYAIAGLSGYVNSGTNYFPIMVTRVYYKSKGTYTFRLEGKADNPLPAVAQSWDHILSAFYYPTSYQGVAAIITDPYGFNQAVPIKVDSDTLNHHSGTYYKVDLRELEIKDKQKIQK